MPYLAVDLDARELAANIANGLGLHPGVVQWGLEETWKFGWRMKTDQISAALLLGCFGPDARILPAVVAHGFLEDLGGGQFRIRGAERYLRISRAQSAGGKKAAGNLKKGGEPGRSRGGLPAVAGEEPGRTPGLVPALTAISDQRSAISTFKKSPEQEVGGESPATQAPAPQLTLETEQPFTDAARQVFEHWSRATGGRSKFTPERRRRVDARLAEGYTPEQLCRAVDGCLGDDWHAQNGRTDLELICRSAVKVDDFIARAERLGALAGISEARPCCPICGDSPNGATYGHPLCGPHVGAWLAANVERTPEATAAWIERQKASAA
jgi:hypothetical protein